MNVYFVTDHPFWESNGLYYSGGGLPYTLWNRYIKNNINLYIIGRRSVKHNNTLSSTQNVKFKLSNYYKKPIDAITHYKRIKIELYNYLQNADRVILRLPSWLGLISQQVCIERNIPYAIEVVADAYDSYHNYGNISGTIFAPLYHLLNKLAISKSKYTLYVTQNYLQKRYPNQNETIGCTDTEINSVEEFVLEKRLRRISQQSYRRLICGQIGNIEVKYKGYHIMLRAMSLLKKDGILIDYHIVGGGDSQYIKSLALKYGIEDQVVIRGKMPHEEISKFLDEIDIYVHPSFQEGLPRVIVEAISRGCPCLASSVAGTPELIEDKFLHIPGDTNKLYNDLSYICNNPKIMEQMASRNYNHAKQYYSDILDKRRLEFYTKFYDQQ